MSDDAEVESKHLQMNCWCGHGEADSDVSALSLDGAHFMVPTECVCEDHHVAASHLHKTVVCKECEPKDS